MGLGFAGAGFGLALAVVVVLGGCAARAPGSRSAPPVPAYVPESQLTPVDVAIPPTDYPHEALATNFEGSVLLSIYIDETGRVRDAVVIRDPGRGLGEAARRAAIAHFRFKPPSLVGWWRFTVTYELPRR